MGHTINEVKILQCQMNYRYYYNHGHNIFDKLPIFFLPQVKRSVIISNKHDICKLPHDLPHNLRLKILGNKKKVRKISKLHGIII